METKTTLDDIVFEHRNQAYGAYDLRKSYPAALRKALIIGSVLFLLLFLLPTIFAHLRPKVEYSEREIVLEEFSPPVDEKTEPVVPPPPVEKPQVNMVRNFTPEVLTEVEDETPPPPVEAFKNAVSGPETVDGTTDAPEIVAPPEDAAPDAKAAVVEAESEIMGFNVVEIQPQFPGGMDELARFIGKNLRYPSNAAKMGIQGKVYISFVVQTDGSISDVMAQKGIGFGCDEEALRVIRAMPTWKPGSQSGRRVRVKFNMPIAFTLQD